jgi:hypothetical protein
LTLSLQPEGGNDVVFNGIVEFYVNQFVPILVYNVSAPVITTPANSFLWLSLNNGSINSSGPFIAVNGGSTLYGELKGFTNFFQGIANQACIAIDATSYADVEFYDNATVGAGTLTVATGGTFDILLADAGVQLDQSYLTLPGFVVDAPDMSTTLTFQPNGTQAINVYTTEAALAAATQLLNGAPYTIFFDLSFVSGFYTFTTIGALNLAPGGTWTDKGITAGNGSPAQFSNQLTFANGTVMPNPPSHVYGFIQIEVNQAATAWQSTTNSGNTTFHDYVGAWSNAGMGPLISSVDFWLLTLDDSANLNFGPVATGPLTPAELNFALRVNLQANDNSYVGPNTINFDFSISSPAIFVDPTNYPYLSISGLFVDPTGTGNTIIPAQISGTEESDVALLYVAGSGGTGPGTFYCSDGSTKWIPLAQAGQTTLTNGVSPSVPINYIDANSEVLLTYASPNGSTAFGTLLPSTITSGQPGAIVISSYASPGTVNVNDQSTVTWCIVQKTP